MRYSLQKFIERDAKILLSPSNYNDLNNLIKIAFEENETIIIKKLLGINFRTEPLKAFCCDKCVVNERYQNLC